MNSLKLVAAFVQRRPLTWGFHALTLALGVAVVSAVLSLSQGLDDRFGKDLADINLVVGTKGSPMQLILSSIYQVDAPTGNIPLQTANMLAGNMMVRRAVPISLGDNVAGFRIVGTSPLHGDIYGARIARGGWWTAPMQTVLGADAARRLDLDVGNVFVGDHGLAPGGEAHKDNPYRVVGILAPTGAVIDRLVLADTASVWKVHEHEAAEHAGALAAGQAIDPSDVDHSPDGREVTAVLVTYRSAMGALMLPRILQSQANLQTAVPAIEMARLNAMIGTGADVLRGLGVGLLVLSALGFFVALFAAVSQRRRELALLRVLGARPARLFVLVCLEAMALGVVGGGVGWAIGRAAARFAVYGDKVYPDATFSPRLSYGKVAGWTYRGQAIPYATTFKGLWERATGQDPFALAPRWESARGKLSDDTVFDFVTTNDITGGNSGSPVLNAKGEVIGAAFDGNIHSLGGAFAYDGTLNRTVVASTAAATEAFVKVYGQQALVEELLGKPTKKGKR